MKRSYAKYWSAVKFGFLLGVKSWPRITVSPFVGAFCGMLKEVRRMRAEIDAYNAKLFGDAHDSKGVEGCEPKGEFHHLAR